MANTKYIATLRLDLSKLNKDTEEVNKLLKSIGAGVNLDMSDVVEKQVKQMLTRLKNEVQKAASTGGQAGKKMAEGLSEAKTEIERVVSVTSKLAKDGSLTETVKGYKDLGTTISEVRKEGELLSRTTTVKGELSKEIEKANALYKEQVGYLKEMYSLRTQRLAATDGSEQAKKLDEEIQKYGALIAKSREQIASLSDEAKQLSNINKLGEERAKIIKQYQAALKADSNGDTGLKQMTEEYGRLAEYVRYYNNAKKTGQDTAYWKERIEASSKLLTQQGEELKKLDLTADKKQKLLDLEQKITDAKAKQNTSNPEEDGTAALAKAQAA